MRNLIHLSLYQHQPAQIYSQQTDIINYKMCSIVCIGT